MACVRVGNASEIPEGGQKFVKAGGKRIYVTRVSGQVYAADSSCPCPLSGGVLSRVIEHEGAPCVECDARCYTLAFDLRTGLNVRKYNFEVAVYPTRVEGDEIFLEMQDGG